MQCNLLTYLLFETKYNIDIGIKTHFHFTKIRMQCNRMNNRERVNIIPRLKTIFEVASVCLCVCVCVLLYQFGGWPKSSSVRFLRTFGDPTSHTHTHIHETGALNLSAHKA